MKTFKTKLLIAGMIFLCFQTIKSQNLLSQVELESFLDKAELQSQKYTKVFKNLSAIETKTKFYYKTNGALDEKRFIKSLFIVYESSDGKRSQEYRNVLEFNGKNVSRDERETEKFFAKLAEVDSAQEEFNRILKESMRFDGKSVSWGLTLFQNRPFTKALRPFFNFKVVGKEKIENHETLVIEYEQTKTTPLIIANPTDEEKKLMKGEQIEYSTNISDKFRPTNPLLNGKIWLDAETAQIWRNELKTNLHPANLTKPIVSIEIYNEYQQSDFEILVPKNFLIRSYLIKGAGDKNLMITKDVESIYEFSKFTEFKTEAKDYQITSK
jgi:hypothetical protein